jgi:hypothetical protein
MPQSYSEALTLFESFKNQQDLAVYDYYHALFKHELSEFEENYTKWESNRIY